MKIENNKVIGYAVIVPLNNNDEAIVGHAVRYDKTDKEGKLVHTFGQMVFPTLQEALVYAGTLHLVRRVTIRVNTKNLNPYFRREYYG